MRHERSIRTPTARVRGLGPAKSGTGDFVRSRVSGVANGLVTPPLIAIFVGLSASGRAEVIETLSHPAVALLAVLFVITAVHHMKLGMQVIIEDYVHAEGRKLGLLVANAFYCGLVGVIAGFAILKLAFAP
jgi:succinate dehydrogenase / fumarate reductase membrane anchor subunit